MTKALRVLIAYDGSPCADDAIADLPRAGLPNEVEALVLSVADLWFLPGGEAVPPTPMRIKTLATEARATATAMIESAQIRAQSAAERVRTMFPTWQVTAKSMADSPAWAIILEAEAWQADLIIVGSHGYSQLSRWLLGSVSQTVLTQATCSVRIARGRSTTPHHALRVLVGVDGSDEAEMAVRAVAARTWPAGTDVRLVMVLDPIILNAIKQSPKAATESLPTETLPDEVESEDAINNLLARDKAIVQAGASPVTVSTLLLPGDPKRMLIDEAESWGADCIFIGSRGLNRWERLLLGSVSTAIAARARCPVEIVRLPRAQA